MQDLVLGMLKAHAYGDAFGAQYEFDRLDFSDEIKYHVKVPRRFQDNIYLPVGSVTDDTEMTMALMKSIANKDYDIDTLIVAYNTWVNNAVCAGKNTRILLKFKVKPDNIVACFMRRWRSQNPRSQSNGSLMRCAPLALLPEIAWVKDCNITNPTLLNRTCSKIYLTALRSILNKTDIKDVYRTALRSAAANSILKPYMIKINKKEQLSVGEKRGWVLHAFCLAIETLRYLAITPKDKVSLIYIHQQVQTHITGDTDTNAAISAALIGAYLGYEKLLQNETVAANIAKINMPDYEPLVTQYIAKYANA